MKNNYSSYFSNIKKTLATLKMLLIAFIIVGSAFFNIAVGGVIITVPTLPQITGCSFPTAYSALGNIVITESLAGDISTFGTLILTAPANFEFQNATGSVGFTASRDITTISAVSITPTTITFQINGITFTNLDVITISGIQVRGITGPAGPQYATRTGGTSVIAGDANGAQHASFTSYLNSVTGGTITAAQTICSGGDPANLTFSSASTGTGVLSYQWQSGTDGSTFPTNLGTTTSYDPPSGLTTTTYYRCVTTSTLNSIACTANSNVIAVTINAVTGGTIASAQTICSGGDPSNLSFSVASTGAGTLTYQWQTGTDGSTFPSNVGTSTPSYDPPSGLATTTYYRCITTSTLGVVCTATSNVIIVTINSVTPGTITGSQTICNAGDPSILTFSTGATGSSTLTYQWQSGTDGTTFPTNLGTGTSYDPPSGLTTTTYYRCIATSTLNGIPCTAISNMLTVTVQAAVGGGTIATSQTICSGGNPAAFTESGVSTGSGVLSYQWQTGTDGSTFPTNVGSNSTTYAPSGIGITTYYRRVTTSTTNGVGCTANSNVLTVTINSVTGGTITSSQTICNAGDPANLTFSSASTGSGSLSYQWQTGTDGSTFPSNVGANSTSYDPPSGLATTTYYRCVTTSTLNGVTCTANSSVITVTVQSAVTPGSIASAQTICSGGDPAIFTEASAATGSGTLSYQWQTGTDGSTFPTNVGSNSTTYDAPSGLVINTYYRRVVTSTQNGVGCTANSAALLVTINNVTGGTITAAQTICSSGDPANLTFSIASSGTSTLSYQWQSGTDGTTFPTNLGTGVSYDPPSGLATTTYYRCVTTSTYNGVGCSANSNVIIVTVNSVTGGTITAAQTICSGGDPENMSFSSASTGTGTLSYQWQTGTDGSTFPTIVGTNTNTYDPPTGLATLTYYRCVTTSTLNSVTCTANSNVITVTINAVTGGTIANDQTVCNAGDPSNLTFSSASTGSGTLSYQWQKGTDGTTFPTNVGTNTVTYDPPTGLATTSYYRCITTSTLGGVPCTAISNFITVTVQNAVTGGTIGSAQTICSGGDPSILTFSSAPTGSGVLSYQWRTGTDGSTFPTNVGLNTPTYDPPSGLVTTTYYRCFITSTQNGILCTAISNVITVTINAVAGGTIASDQTICNAGDPATLTFSAASSGSGTLTYQWQSGTDGSTFPTNLGTSTSYDPPSGLIVTTYFRCITTSTLGGIICSAISNVITVTVQSAVTGGSVAANQTICSGGDPAAFTQSGASTGSGSLSYQWQTGIDGSSFPTNVGTDLTTYDAPSGLAVTTYYRRVTTSTTNGVGCTANSNVITVTINEVSGGTIASSQTICNAGDPANLTFSVASTGPGTLSYQWQTGTDGTTFPSNVGANLTSYDPPSGLATTTYYRCVTTSTLNGVICTALSNVVTVTVQSAVTGGTIASAQTICSGGDPAAFMESGASSGSGILSYQWQTGTDGSTFPSNVGTSTTYNAPSGLAITTYYRRVTTSTTNGVGCTANSNIITVTINDITGGAITASQTICSGGDPTNLSFSSASTGSGTLSYQWQTGTDGSTFPTNVGANIATYDPPSGLAITTYYRCVTTSTLSSIVCTAISNVVIVTINDVTAGTIAAAQTVCNGGDPSPLNFSSASTGTGVLSYQWQTGTDGTTFPTNVGTNTVTYNPPSGLGITTYYRCLTTSTLNSIVCTATSNTIAVTINNVTGGTITAPQTICSGGDALNLTFSPASTGSGTLTYQWQSGTDGSTFPTSLGTGASYDPPSGLAVTTYYRCITTSTVGGVPCTANSNVIIVTINSVSGGTIAASQTICSGGDPVNLTFSSASTGAGTLSYQWQTGTDGSTFPTNVGANATSYDPPSGLVTSTYYRCVTTSTLNGITCTANSTTVTITINDVTGGTIIPSQTICNAGDPSILSFSSASTGSGTLSYQWQSGTDGSTFPTNVGTNSTTYDPPSGILATIYYRCVTTSTWNGVACTANSTIIAVTINDVTGGTITAAQTICSGGDPAAFTQSGASTGSGVLSYQWQTGTDGSTFPTNVGTNSTTYDAPPGLATTTYYRRVTTSTQNGVGCTANSNVLTATINVVAGGTIASSQTICNAGDPANISFSIASTGPGTLSYQWQTGTDGSTFPTNVGGNSTSYDPPSGLATTTYYRCVTTSTLNGVACTAVSNVVTVTVQSAVTGGTIASAQTICSGGDPVAFTESGASTGSGTLSYQWQTGTDGSTFPTNVGSNSTTYDAPSGLAVTTYYRRVTTSTQNGTGCTANSNIIAVTINAVTGGTITAAQTICSGGDPANLTFSSASTGSALSYQWQTGTDGSTFPTNVGTNSTSYNPPSGLTTTTYYRCVTTSTLNSIVCTAISNVIIVTINDVTGGTIASAETICSGGDPSNLTFSSTSTGSGVLSYQWQTGTDGTTFPTNVGVNTATYNPPSGLLVTTYYRCTTTSTLNGVTCSAISNVITVTINAVTGGTIAAAQTICNGGDPSNLTFSSASTGSGALTYQWQTGTDGITFPTNLGTATSYDPPSGITTNTYYRCVTTSTLNSIACTAFSNVIMITVQNAVTGGTIVSDQTICSGGNPSILSFSSVPTGSGTLSYQWQTGTDGSTFPTNVGINIATYDPPSGLAITTYYRCVVTSTLNGITCTAISNAVTVTINEVTGGVVISSQTICNAGDPSSLGFSSASTGSGSLSYQWQSGTDGSTFPTNVGTNSDIYDPPLGLTTTTYYRCVTTSTLNSIACNAISNIITVTVQSVVTGGTIATAQTICSGGDPAAFTQSGASTGSGVLSYQWQTGTDGSTFPTIVGGNSTTYDAPPGLGITTYYRRVTTSTQNGVSCISNSNVISVTINSVIGGTIATSQTICNNGDPANLTFSSASTGAGTLSYQWQTGTDGITFPTNVGGNSASYDPPSGLTITTYYRCITTSTLNSIVCTAISNTVTVTVQGAVTGGTIASAQTICSGGDPAAFTESGSSTGSGVLSYQWQTGTDGSTFPSNVGANSTIYDAPSGLAITTYYRRVTTSTINGVGCNANSNVIAVTINNVTGGTVVAAQSICSGGNPSAFTESVAATGSGSLTYQWKQSTDGYVTTLATTTTYDAPSGLAATTTYRRISTSTLGIVGCAANADVLVTINGAIGNNTISAAQTICFGSTPNALIGSIPTGGDNSYTYLWESSTTDGSSGFSTATGTNNNADYTPGSLTVNTWYRRKITSCTSLTDVSSSIGMTINQIPVATATNSSQTRCSGTTFTTMVLNTSNGVAPTTYTWTRDKSSEITGVATSGSGDITSDSLFNTTSDTVTVTFTITPTGPSPTFCVGTDITATIKVKPSPVLTSSWAPGAICSGDIFSYTALSSTTGATFSWSRPLVTNISPATSFGTGNVSEALSNSTTSSINVTYIYQVSANGCLNPTSFNVVLPVSPLPILSSTLTPSAICSGSVFSYTPTSITSGTSFVWSRPIITGISNGSNNGAGDPYETLNNSTYAVVNAKYGYTLTANGCTNPISDTVIVPVKPSALLSSNLNPASVCSGDLFSYVPTCSTSGASYVWSRAAVAGISNVNANGVTNINEALFDTTTAPVNATYLYTTTANSCSYDQNVVVTVNPLPTLNSNLLPPAICSGTIFSYLPTSSTTGAIFTWTRDAVIGISNSYGSGSDSPNEILTNTTGDSVNVIYKYTVSANGCTNPTKFNVVVRVYRVPTLISNTAPPAICSGDTFSYTPISSIAGTSFLWTRAAIGGISNLGGSGTDNPSEILTDTIADPVNVTYVYTLTAAGCTNPITYNVVVPVNPTPKLSSTITPTAICSGANFSYTPTSATSGVTFTWTRAAVVGISNPSGVGGDNPNELLIDTTTSPVNVTYIYTLSADGCTNATTYSVVIRVNPTPIFTSSLSPATICSGVVFSYTPSCSTTGASFAWSRSAVSGISNSFASDTASISETLTDTITSFVNVTYIYTVSAYGCTNPSPYTVVVRVNPMPTLTSSLTAPAICSGATFDYTPTSGTTGVSFTWTRAAIIGISNLADSGSFSPGEMLTNITADTINVTYVYTLAADGCINPTTYSVVVAVYPTPLLSSTLTPTAICSGTTFSYTPTSGTSGATFSWTRAAISGIGNISGGGADDPNEVLFDTTAIPVNVTYVYTVAANGCANATPYNIIVKVNPSPLLTSSIAPPSICSGSVFNYSPLSSTLGATFTWTRPAIVGISNIVGNDTGGVSETLTDTIASPVIVTYVYTVSANSCTNPTNYNVVDTVFPTPLLTSSLAPSAMCSGTTFSYIPTSGTTGVTFSWIRAAVAGISNLADTGAYNPNEVLINTTADTINVTYIYNLAANGCANSSSYNVVVAVFPTPSLSSSLTPSAICSGTVFSYTPTSATAGASFLWTRATVTGISNISGSGADDPNEVLFDTTSAAVNVTYIYTVSANGCSNTNNVVVKVNPVPTLTSTLTSTGICSGAIFSYSPLSSVSGATFAWTRPAVPGISNSVGNGTGIVSETLFDTTTASKNVTYVYTVTADNCSNATNYNVVVAVSPTPTLTSSLTPPAICSGTTFGYNPTSGTSSVSFSWTRAAVAGISNLSDSGSYNPNEVLTNITADSINVTYVYTLAVNGCTNPTTYSVVVTVYPLPLLTSTLNPSAICSGTAFSYTPTSGTSGVSFLWTRAAVFGVSNLSGGGSDNPNEFLVDTTTVPVNVTYVYTLSANGCINPSTYSVVVNVNLKPTLSSTLTPPGICSGSVFNYIPSSATIGATFTWTRATVSGVSNPTGSGIDNVSETLFDTTAASKDVTYIYTVSANGCINSETYNVVVTLSPIPTFTSSLTAPAICSGTVFGYNPTSGTSGVTFSWSRAAVVGISNLADTGSYNPNEVLNNTTINAVTVTYVYSLSANGCTNPTTYSVTVIVNPMPTLTSIASPNAICSGTIFNYVPTSQLTGVTFLWSRDTVPGLANIAGSGNGAIAELLNLSDTIPVNVTYVFTLYTGLCTNATPFPVTLTVNKPCLCNYQLTSSFSPPAICDSTVFSYPPLSPTTGATFTWTRAAVYGISNPEGWGNENPNEILDDTTLSSINVTYIYSVSANGCTNLQTFNVIVSVNPTPTLSSTLTPSAICSGTNFIYVPASPISGATFTWTRATVAGISNPFGSGSGIPSEILTDTTTAPVNVTYEFIVTANGCTNPITYNVVVLVNPTPTLSSTLTPAAICSGDTFSYTPTSATPNATFVWNRPPVTGISQTQASGTDNPNEMLTNLTTFPLYVTYTFTISADGCDYVQNVVVTVNPTPELSSSSTPSSICSGTVFNYAPTSSTAGVSFVWTRAGVTGVSNVAGSGTDNPGEILTDTIASAVNVTYIYTLSSNGCANPISDSVVVTVNPNPTLSSSSTPPAICSGTSFYYTPTSGTAGTTYTWTRAAVSGISNAPGNGTGIPNEILTDTIADSVNVTYQFTLSANTCINATPYNVIVTVYPIPTLSSSITVPAICSGSVFSYTPISATPNATFDWTRASVGGISEAPTSGTGDPAETLTSLTTFPLYVTYSYIVSANGCSNATAYNVVVTVSPTPELSSSIAPTSICSGTVFNYIPTSSTLGVLFAWTRAAVSGISNATVSGTGNPAETLIDTVTFPVNVTYIYTLSANGCTNPKTDSIIVTINPNPALSSSLTPPAICSGTAFYYTPTSGTAGTLFSWSRSAVSGISNIAATGIGNPNEILNDTTGAIAIVTYIYTLSANGCVNSITYSVVDTVYPVSTFTSTLTPSAICSGTTFSYTPISGIPGASFTWTRATVLGISNTAGSGIDDPNETLTNTSTDPINVTYVYSLSANGCSNATTFNVIVEVNPMPTLNSSLTPPTICSGTVFSYIPTSATAGTIFDWDRVAITGVNNATDSGTYNPNETLFDTITVPVSVTYEYTLSANGCTNSTIYSVVVIIDPSTEGGIVSSNATVCSGSNNGMLILNGETGSVVQWEYSTDGSTWMTINNSTSALAYNNLTMTTIYRAVVQEGTCSIKTSSYDTITVNSATVGGMVSSNASVCSNLNTGTLNLTGSAGNIVNWISSSNGGITWTAIPSTTGTQSYTYNNLTTTIWYTALIKSGVCPIDTALIAIITVNPSPLASFTSTTVCVGQATTFVNGSSISNGLIDLNMWDFGDTTYTSTPFVSPVLHTYNQAGTYSVTLVVTSDIGCETPLTSSVIVNALPDPTISANLPLFLCSGNSIILSAVAGSGITYYWNPGGATTQNITVDTAGTYVLTVTSSSGCSSSDSVFIASSLVVNAGNDITVNYGTAVTLHGEGGIIYSWSPITGLDNPNVSNPVLTPLVTTTYVLTAIDANGCAGSDSLTVTVLSDHNLIISNIMTPNSDGKNDTWIIINIDDYPNTEIIIVNNQGQQVYKSSSYDNSWDGTYNGKPLPDATYYYFLKFASDKKVYTGAITIFNDK